MKILILINTYIALRKLRNSKKASEYTHQIIDSIYGDEELKGLYLPWHKVSMKVYLTYSSLLLFIVAPFFCSWLSISLPLMTAPLWFLAKFSAKFNISRPRSSLGVYLFCLFVVAFVPSVLKF